MDLLGNEVQRIAIIHLIFRNKRIELQHDAAEKFPDVRKETVTSVRFERHRRQNVNRHVMDITLGKTFIQQFVDIIGSLVHL